MRFFGNGIVYFSPKKKITFDISKRESVDHKGFYDTDDYSECVKLKALGYEHKGEMPEAPKKKTESKEKKTAKK